MRTRIPLIAGFLVVGVIHLHAATILVTSTADSGAGTLRAALASAANGDTIDATGVSGTIVLTSGELLVSNSVSILGPGAAIGPGPGNLAVDGNHASRVFHIGSNTVVSISSLTISNGNANTGSFSGGGVYNDHSTLTVSNCTLSGNLAGDGGGIFNNAEKNGSATLQIVNSTVSRNAALWKGGGIFSHGYFYGSATVQIVNSTLSRNSAGFGGGGIWNEPGWFGSATLTISASTISGNWAGYGGGIVNNSDNSGSLEIGDTILNANSPENIRGTVTSIGYNLSSDAAGGDGTTGPGGLLNATGDIRNTDPLLGPLQNNGGPTFTHALWSGSPCINAGDPNFTPPPDFDQRGPGFPRVVCGRIDIGAFETADPTPPSVTCPDNIVTVSDPGQCSKSNVTYSATASGGCGTVTITCTPPSGSTFGLGVTPVNCTATDTGGGTASCSFQVTVLSSVTCTFLPPLAGQPVANKFKSGQTIPHTVDVKDCNGNPVTSGITVKIDVVELDSSNASYSNDLVENFTGVGDPGGTYVLVDGHWQYNLKTTGYEAGTVNNTRYFRSRTTVYVGTIVVGQCDIILDSK